MQNKNDIYKELLEISQLMAATDNKNNLYQVPANYFESFSDMLMLRIKGVATESAGTEIGLLSSIISSIDKKKSIYQVPENYFENFPEKILAKIKSEAAQDASEELAMLSPLLSKSGKKNPYTIPEGFFNELSDNLVSEVKAVSFVQDELENINPLLSDLKKKETYEVPQGYFNQLPEAILLKIKNQQTAKIVEFKKGISWLKYAVAAAITGIIFTIGILTFNNKTGVEEPTAGLSNVSDQEITNYLDNHDNPLADPNTSTATLELNDNDVSELLGNVPDNELEQYASDHAGPKDLITN